MTRELHRLCVLLLFVSVIFAGIDVSHASEIQGQHQISVSHISDFHDGVNKDTSSYDQIDCHEHSSGPEKAPATNHGEKGGCCHSASSPAFAVRDLTAYASGVFEANNLTPHKDREVASHIPDGQLRPPRA